MITNLESSDSDGSKKEGKICLEIIDRDWNKIENDLSFTLIRPISVLVTASIVATLSLFLLCSTVVYAGDNFLDFDTCNNPLHIDSCKVSVDDSGNFVFASNPDPNDISTHLNVLVEKNLNKKVADFKAGTAVGYNYGLLDGVKGAIKDSEKYSKGAEVVKTSSDFKAGFKTGYDDGHDTGNAIKQLKTIESHSKK
jgi:hypothetical protein